MLLEIVMVITKIICLGFKVGPGCSLYHPIWQSCRAHVRCTRPAGTCGTMEAKLQSLTMPLPIQGILLGWMRGSWKGGQNTKRPWKNMENLIRWWRSILIQRDGSVGRGLANCVVPSWGPNCSKIFFHTFSGISIWQFIWMKQFPLGSGLW